MLLKRIGKFRASREISGITNKGDVIVISSFDGCVYFIKESGELVGKYCSDSEVLDVDANGKVVAVTRSGKALIFENSNLTREFYVGDERSVIVVALGDSFITCYKDCLKSTYDGKFVWRKRFGMVIKKAKDDMIYLYDRGGKVLGIDENGNVKMIKETYANAIDACSNYLVIAKGKNVTLFKDGEPVTSFEGLEWVTYVVFSNDCKKLAMVEGERGILHIRDLEGEEKATITFNGWLTALKWINDTIVAGYNDGLVEIFQVVESRDAVIRYHIVPKGYLVEMKKHEWPIIFMPKELYEKLGRPRYVEAKGVVLAVMPIEGEVVMGPFEGVVELNKVKVRPRIEITFSSPPAEGVIEMIKGLQTPLFAGAIIKGIVDGVVSRIDGALSAWPSDSEIEVKVGEAKGKVVVVTLNGHSKDKGLGKGEI